MYKGDTQTIAEKGISPQEVTEAVQEIAREAIGSREAIWNAIHDDRQKTIRRIQFVATIAMVALCLALVLLYRTTLS